MNTSAATHKQIEVIEFRPLRKGESLKGFVTLELPSSLCLHDCAYHERSNGTRWISMPTRPYTAKDGSSSWQQLVDFSDRAGYDRFQIAALEALDRYFASGLPGEAEAQPVAASQAPLVAEARKPREQASPEITDADIPF